MRSCIMPGQWPPPTSKKFFWHGRFELTELMQISQSLLKKLIQPDEGTQSCIRGCGWWKQAPGQWSPSIANVQKMQNIQSEVLPPWEGGQKSWPALEKHLTLSLPVKRDCRQHHHLRRRRRQHHRHDHHDYNRDQHRNHRHHAKHCFVPLTYLLHIGIKSWLCDSKRVTLPKSSIRTL